VGLSAVCVFTSTSSLCVCACVADHTMPVDPEAVVQTAVTCRQDRA